MTIVGQKKLKVANRVCTHDTLEINFNHYITINFHFLC